MRCLPLFVALAVAAGFAQSASAADMPAKAAAIAPVAAPSWTGFYLGISGGYGWGRSEQTDISVFGPFTSGQYSIDGVVLGATAGYNWQTGPLVLGVETDLSFASIRGSTVGTSVTAGPCI